MVVYLDMVFLINWGTDALALYMTALLAGITVRWKKIFLASLAGGLYGVISLLPPFVFMSGMLGKCVMAAGMVYIAFNGGNWYFRRLLLFLMISCTIGGGILAAAEVVARDTTAEVFSCVGWKAFFLVTACCYTILTLAFRGGGKHIVSKQLCRGWVERDDRHIGITILLDTGHTLIDPVNGQPALIVEAESLRELWTDEEGAVFRDLRNRGTVECLQRLNLVSCGRFHLLPYRAVGIESGLLLAFLADSVAIDGKTVKKAVVAVSPTPLSENGEYSALWGGMDDERRVYCAA